MRGFTLQAPFKAQARDGFVHNNRIFPEKAMIIKGYISSASLKANKPSLSVYSAHSP